jgi:AraC-like DNA-binding protein
MRFQLDWNSLIYALGISYGFFFASILLGVKRRKKEADKSLAFFVISYVLFIVPYFLTRTGAYLVCPHLLGVFTPFYFTIGPLFFIYVKVLTTPRFVFSKKYLLHFIPFGLSFLTWVPFYFYSGSHKLYLYTNSLIRSPMETNIIRIIRLAHLLIYLVLVFHTVKRHKTNIKECFSSIDRIKLGWIQFLAILMASDVIGYFVMTVLGAVHPELYEVRKTIFGIWKSVVIFLIGYKGLTQPIIFLGREGREEKEKYSSSKLTPTQSEVYPKKLQGYMNVEKPYLESELSLNCLAEKVDIPPRYLSQVINEKLNQNFFDFVNRYRVEEAKKLLLCPANPDDTILDIAFDCGFNTKSSFNFVFKKISLLTPSQFRRKHEEKKKDKRLKG